MTTTSSEPPAVAYELPCVAGGGVDVVLARRGMPLFRLLPTTEEQILGRQTGRGDGPAAPWQPVGRKPFV
ncbi:MAG: hypothetical protein ABSC95_17510 [Acetobacteraceae bacterium]